jgi:hypothetical protein
MSCRGVCWGAFQKKYGAHNRHYSKSEKKTRDVTPKNGCEKRQIKAKMLEKPGMPKPQIKAKKLELPEPPKRSKGKKNTLLKMT